ncbi:hypothetical protein GCM10008955_32340 [Deinococcus malanensis]|uniref:AlgX/AlgJ SGNH hydrolase-like domain-containing protein n=1 Tax=Deinococcus malanensis TaxID=1706855 RepID=A0ABQ2F2S8_9DEIO|nr:hypothetical protein GCM10008955_32340 [Deinococcus malanensis]
MVPSCPSHANEVIVGKSGWLYYTYDTTESLDIGVSLNLIRGVERALARNGTRLVVLVTSMKARIYPEYLPAGFKIPQAVGARYSRTIKFMRANRILAPDLSAAFRSSPRRVADIPLYFRQDTHWSPKGGTEAARTLAAYLGTQPSLLKGVPGVNYALVETKPGPMKGDLYKLLLAQGKTVPVADKHYGLELTRATGSADLLGDEAPGIALVGSSYSAQWLGFPNALRFALKKDVFDLSVPADRGQWHGLETYLHDDAFQTSRPKILIWEMLERDLTSYPDAKWKQPRYRSNNTEWLVRSVQRG